MMVVCWSQTKPVCFYLWLPPGTCSYTVHSWVWTSVARVLASSCHGVWMRLLLRSAAQTPPWPWLLVQKGAWSHDRDSGFHGISTAMVGCCSAPAGVTAVAHQRYLQRAMCQFLVQVTSKGWGRFCWTCCYGGKRKNWIEFWRSSWTRTRAVWSSWPYLLWLRGWPRDLWRSFQLKKYSVVLWSFNFLWNFTEK